MNPIKCDVMSQCWDSFITKFIHVEVKFIIFIALSKLPNHTSESKNSEFYQHLTLSVTFSPFVSDSAFLGSNTIINPTTASAATMIFMSLCKHFKQYLSYIWCIHSSVWWGCSTHEYK